MKIPENQRRLINPKFLEKNEHIESSSSSRGKSFTNKSEKGAHS